MYFPILKIINKRFFSIIKLVSGHFFPITGQYVARRIELYRKFLSGPKTRCIFGTQLSLLFFFREGI